jgi:uncharacterized protein (UPF0264 family)
MTGLLVSVRSATEGRIALAAGVDVIDIKEPARGSLGAATSETIQDVLDAVDGRAIVSAACGELLNASKAPHLPARGLALAKIALAGCGAVAGWQNRWRDWTSSLPGETEPVGVVYADWHLAQSPPWQEVLAVATDASAPYLLVDTFDKTAGTLFDHWSNATLQACAREVRAVGMGLVLAGSLSGDAILRAREFSPDFVAVRGAACRGGRTGGIEATAIRRILAALGKPPGISLAPAAN